MFLKNCQFILQYLITSTRGSDAELAARASFYVGVCAVDEEASVSDPEIKLVFTGNKNSLFRHFTVNRKAKKRFDNRQDCIKERSSESDDDRLSEKRPQVRGVKQGEVSFLH